MTDLNNRRNVHEDDGPHIVDLLLIDHIPLKECISVILNKNSTRLLKFSAAKMFLQDLHNHSAAELKAVYTPLVKNEELHFNILEAQVEHGIIDERVSFLLNNIQGLHTLNDEVEAELRVLSGIVLKHIEEEENQTLPLMEQLIDDHTLHTIGENFLKLRKIQQDVDRYAENIQSRMALQ